MLWSYGGKRSHCNTQMYTLLFVLLPCMYIDGDWGESTNMQVSVREGMLSQQQLDGSDHRKMENAVCLYCTVP